jgi:hypothetical protein
MEANSKVDRMFRPTLLLASRNGAAIWETDPSMPALRTHYPTHAKAAPTPCLR